MQNPLLIENFAKQHQEELLKLAEEFRQAARAMEASRPQPEAPRPSPRREFHFLKWVITLTEASKLDPCLQDLADH
jgi:hypothetical protein